MKITSDSILGLKRHFVGTLNAPSPVWLRMAEEPQIGFSGEGVEERVGGCTIDFGVVPAPGEHRRIVRVENLGQEVLSLNSEAPPPWLEARWVGGGPPLWLGRGRAVDLELIFRGEEAVAQPRAGSFKLQAEMSGLELCLDAEVRVVTRLFGAYGRWGFQGSKEAAPFDFVLLDPLAGPPQEPPIYTLSVESLGTEPLEVCLSDLPDWLIAVAERAVFRGPSPGPFFTARAPFRLSFEPVPSVDFPGAHEAEVTLRSNDQRPEFQALSLPFSVQIETAGLHVPPIDSLFLPTVLDVLSTEPEPPASLPASPFRERVVTAYRVWRYLALACLALALLSLVLFLLR